MDNSFFSEKISIEPDLGDQRKSTWKALPAPPKTPKRIMMKYRFSAVFPFVFALASFVLNIVVMLAGKEMGTFGGHYLIALNTSRVGQDVIRFEQAIPASATPSTISLSAPNDRDSPLNGQGGLLDPLASNLTNAFNDGLGILVNSAVEGMVDTVGIAGIYYLYLQNVCWASMADVEDSNAGSMAVERCESWGEARSHIARGIGTSVVIGQTNISIPLITTIAGSLDTISSGLSNVRRAALALLIISLIGSSLSAVSAFPAVIFPHSRLLIYFNLCWTTLGSIFAFLAATILSVLVIGVSSVINRYGDAVGLEAKRGSAVLLFVWLAWLFISLPGVYWGAIWFVEVRKLSFIRRERNDDQIGDWRGTAKEVWSDFKGKKTR